MQRLVFLLTVLALTGCERRPPVLELDGVAMGTTYNVQIVAPDESLELGSLASEIRAAIERVEALASTYRPDSELSLFNVSKSTGWQLVSSELCHLIRAATDLGRQTDGAFDVTVGPLVNLWGFGPDAANDAVPDPADIAAALLTTGHEHLEADCLKPAVRKDIPALFVDLSASAKGYAVDVVAELLDAENVANYLVEIGGELRVRGHNAAGSPFSIAIEMPVSASSQPQAVFKLTDTSVATSGGYRNYFEVGDRRYSHTIDPATGYPVTHDLASVTVIAGEAALADGLATALLVMGPGEGFKFAEDRGLAAMFQVRTTGGFSVIKTGSFKRVTGTS